MLTRTAIATWFTAAHLKITLALALLLAASIAGNVLQHYSARAAAAECTAAAAEQTAALATATAEAERLRAEQIGTLSLLLAADETDYAAERAAIERRISSAANQYRRAQAAQPQADTCRASPDRVRAVNAARGVQ